MEFNVTVSRRSARPVPRQLRRAVLLLIRDNSRERTGRTLLNQFVSSAVSARPSRRRAVGRTTCLRCISS